MAPTVRDVVDEPSFDLRVLCPDAWLDRELRWVTITELPDPSRFLQGGELVLTTGLRKRSGVAQTEFVESLVEGGAAGLGFGTGLSHPSVPRAIRRAAEDHKLPLFEVPYATPFIAITQFIAERISEAHLGQLRTLLAAHDTLAQALLGERGLTALLEELRTMTSSPVAVVDFRGQILASVPESAGWPIPQILDGLGAASDPNGPDDATVTATAEPVVVMPIKVRERVVGALCARTDDPALDILGYAMRLVGLELARRQAVLAGRRQLSGQVVEDVVRATLSGREAERRLDMVGIEPDAFHRVILGTVDADQRILRTLPWSLYPTRERGKPIVTALVGRYFAAICTEHESAPDTAAILLDYLQHLGGPVQIGIGGLYSGVDGIRWSYLEARDALAKGTGIHEGEPLSLPRLLMANPDLPVQELGRATLGPVLDADAAHGGHLTETLRTYLELDGSVQATAERLYIHRNTVRYRLAQVESLTDRSLNSTKDRVHLWLALLALSPEADSGPARDQSASS
jgi:PucR family transcriptional regulator, purine catabolism regulatory protein